MCWMVQFTKLLSFAMSLQLDWGGLYFTYQKLLPLLQQNWRRLDVDAENEGGHAEKKVPKEAIDFKELKRVDHILASLQRKLPQAPPLPPFPEGYTHQSTAEGSENQQAEGQQPPPPDPIIDQGPPSKRMRV
ncbi:unnamed protein product [Cuscuta europaea]|uniref:Uncharacterized protein n=1 Tax=Cuscuta europaea TaxID=41803 RepID=A0A9P0YFW2_CUSEU|nr:unnamed protein product [Cuscuta europaea]